MHQTLLFLLALVGTAVASHDICFYNDQSNAFKFRMAVTLNASRDPHLMQQWGSHSGAASMYSFTNDRGRVDVARTSTWSAAFDGGNWGDFEFQKSLLLAKRVWVFWGCYETTNDDHCKDRDAMFDNCVNIYRGA